MDAALRSWIDAHPYLAPLEVFSQAVGEALSGAPAAALPEPRWDAYVPDHARGVPLLLSPAAGLDVRGPGAAVLTHAAGRVAEASVPEKLAREARELSAWLAASPSVGRDAVDWLLAGGDAPVDNAGLLRFLGWSALQRVLAPVREAYAAWREPSRWVRGSCPTCGAAPAMAQLAGPENERVRTLVCAPCGTRWPYRRVGCPFCETEAPEKLEVLEIEEEPLLRLDVCHACRGYVKTYVGDGGERVLLADWSSLHLDVLARDRGLERRGESLYDL
jgi:FdhE protein